VETVPLRPGALPPPLRSRESPLLARAGRRRRPGPTPPDDTDRSGRSPPARRPERPTVRRKHPDEDVSSSGPPVRRRHPAPSPEWPRDAESHPPYLDSGGAGIEPAGEPPTKPVSQSLPDLRDQQGNSDQIRQIAGGDEEGTRRQQHRAVRQLGARNRPVCQAGPGGLPHGQTLPFDQGGADDTGEEDDPQGGPHADPAPGPDQDGHLGQRSPDEDEESKHSGPRVPTSASYGDRNACGDWHS